MKKIAILTISLFIISSFALSSTPSNSKNKNLPATTYGLELTNVTSCDQSTITYNAGFYSTNYTVENGMGYDLELNDPCGSGYVTAYAESGYWTTDCQDYQVAAYLYVSVSCGVSFDFEEGYNVTRVSASIAQERANSASSVHIFNINGQNVYRYLYVQM